MKDWSLTFGDHLYKHYNHYNLWLYRLYRSPKVVIGASEDAQPRITQISSSEMHNQWFHHQLMYINYVDFG